MAKDANGADHGCRAGRLHSFLLELAGLSLPDQLALLRCSSMMRYG